MIKCPKCGHDNNDDASNCANCHINLKWALLNSGELKIEYEERALEQERNKQIADTLIMTTPTVQGKMISEYIEVISSFVVLGTGLVADLGHMIADAFSVRGDVRGKK